MYTGDACHRTILKNHELPGIINAVKDDSFMAFFIKAYCTLVVEITALPKSIFILSTIFLSLLTLLPSFGYASGDSTIVIKGTVVDEKREPVIGAIVEAVCKDKVRGGAITDFDGNFKIEVPKQQKSEMILKVSEVGYYVKYIQIPNQNISLRIHLQPNRNSFFGCSLIIPYKVPLIDKFSPQNNKTITSEEIEKAAY
jgi:hypothetical protein